MHIQDVLYLTMFKLRKSIIFLILLCLGLILLIFQAHQDTLKLHRDSRVLLDRYYLLRESNPEAAKNALKILLQQDKHHTQALQELSQIYLREGNFSKALPLLIELQQSNRQNLDYTVQLASVYYDYGYWEQAYALLNELKQSPSWNYKLKAQELLTHMSSYLPFYKNNASIVRLKPEPLISQSRVVTILLNYYFQLKKAASPNALQLINLLKTLDGNNRTIFLELGYLSLQKSNNKQALSYFLNAYELGADSEIALQLAYLLAAEKKETQAAAFFLIAMRSDNLKIRQAAINAYALMNTTSHLANPTNTHSETMLMDRFYLLKKQNKEAAWLLIKRIIASKPHSVLALKEGGFLAIELRHRKEALSYFSKAYDLTYDPHLAIQLGYLYDATKSSKTPYTDKYWAYHYFHLTTQTDDKVLALRAQNAMTNLSGLQTKALPEPYFGEIFFDPFTQSRFGITVRPLVGRIGIEHDNRWQSKSYFVFRRTQDNKSINAGQVPQIYEDNVQVLGVGEQIRPIASFPLVGFVEVGRAYDLIDRQRNRWRNDVRSGFMYYNEFGALPAYFEHPTANANYYSTLYGDITYFSRYDNNFIANAKTHQGIRLWQYHSMMLNVYATGKVIEDTNRDFFNNIAEIGPGIGFIPSNRYKLELRFEHLNGVYLPVGTSFNPYEKYYTNNLVQLLFYTKL